MVTLNLVIIKIHMNYNMFLIEIILILSIKAHRILIIHYSEFGLCLSTTGIDMNNIIINL